MAGFPFILQEALYNKCEIFNQSRDNQTASNANINFDVRQSQIN